VTPAPSLGVADIFRQYGPSYRQKHALPAHHRRVMHAIEICRTEALGGVVEFCDHCQYSHTHYRSCRDGHCPQCQGQARLKWLQQRNAELLPTPYFHVVFTLPEAAAAIAQQNHKTVYEILFRTASQTLLTIASDPQHLGVTPGFFCVLHTWGQPLQFHPHLHCLVSSGGLSSDKKRWISGRRDFFLPVRVLSHLFCRLFVEALEKAYAKDRLHFFGEFESLSDPKKFAAYIAALRRDWVVYARPPFGGPQYVVEYLGRYVYRVAISNRRLRSLEDGHVSFEYKDNPDGGKSKIMTLTAEEFIRRWLQHVVPPKFQRIRYYGFLANCHRARNLELCRQLLATPMAALLPSLAQCQQFDRSLQDPLKSRLCPNCGVGVLVVIEHLDPVRVDSS
jgi:Putative transposase/Transposase zinc-binding domain